MEENIEQTEEVKEHKKKFEFDSKKLLIVGIVILLLWLSVLWLMVNYGNELRRHPCNLCAEKIGEDITCTSFDGSKSMKFLTDIANNKTTNYDNPLGK